MLIVYSLNKIKISKSSMIVLDKTAYTCTMMKKLEMIYQLSGGLYSDVQSSEIAQDEVLMNDQSWSDIFIQVETPPDFTCHFCTKKKKLWFAEFNKISQNVTMTRGMANQLHLLLGTVILGINTKITHLLETILKDLLNECIQYSLYTAQQKANIKNKFSKIRREAQAQALERALGRVVDVAIDNMVVNLQADREEDNVEIKVQGEVEGGEEGEMKEEVEVQAKTEKRVEVQAEIKQEYAQIQEEHMISSMQDQQIVSNKSKKEQKKDKQVRKEAEAKMHGNL